MPAALKVLTGPLSQRVLLLPSERGGGEGAPGEVFLLGRSLEANLTLYGPRVEDRHAVLVPEAAGHRLVPVATRHPTFVGEEPLAAARVLQDGDRIRIGKHLLLYVRQGALAPIEDGASPAPAVPGGTCASCGAPLGPTYGAAHDAQALRLGDEVICPRCVDLRLRVDRDLETYRILRKVGTNEEEVTYLAVDLETNHRVGIRILKADRQADLRVFRRFLVRALVGLVLDHPNYLAVKGIRSSHGITYVVMEHVERASKLEVLVREAGPVGVAEAIYVTNQLSEVLRYAREREVVVAKRKKSGVLVDKRFWVKVLAYDVTGILEARVSGTDAFRDLAVRSGADPVALAAVDLAPRTEEEARLSHLASEPAEVYSVGRILYQLLTSRPFSPESVEVVQRAHRRALRRGKPRAGPLSGQPEPLVELLERVLVPKGEGRIRTLEEYTRASKAALSRVLRDGA